MMGIVESVLPVNQEETLEMPEKRRKGGDVCLSYLAKTSHSFPLCSSLSLQYCNVTYSSFKEHSQGGR